MAYYNNRTRNKNSKGGNTTSTSNNNYHVTTKSEVQFYNRNLEETDNSTLSISFWKGNIMFTIHPAFTESERKGLEEGDNRLFNYDVNVTIALTPKQAYKLYKGILQLEAYIRAGKKVTSVAVKTNSKVIKVGIGEEYGVEGAWFLGIFPNDSDEGLLYFFNADTEEDDIFFNYNEENQKGTKKTVNVELDIVKDILREAPLMLSNGYAHETRQEISRLRTFIEKKFENGGASSSRTTRSSGITSRRRRQQTDEDVQVEDQALDFDTTFDPSEFDNTPVESGLSDIADLEKDFLDDFDDEE